MQSLTLGLANRIIEVALRKGQEIKLAPLSVAVLDSGGHLVAFEREDRPGILRFEAAGLKAETGAAP